MRKLWKISALTVLGLSPLVAGMFAPMSVRAAQAKTITWMLPEDPLIDGWGNAVAKGFEKANPGVTVKIITPGSTAYDQKLLTMAAAGQIPDVFTDWGSIGVYTIVDNNLALNLSPYLHNSGIPLAGFYGKEFSFNGQTIGVPWNSNPEFIVYNKDLFKKYHVALPPTSWNDKKWTLKTLLSDAKKLTHNSSNPKTGTFGAVLSADSMGSLAWEWGADPFNGKGGPKDSAAYHGAKVSQTFANSKGMVAAMTWLSDLTNKWKVSPPQGELTAMSTLGNPFFTGRIGMSMVAGGWLERQAAVAKPKFHWGIAPFPYGPAGVDVRQREDNAFYVAKASANPDLAFKLIKYATTGVGAKEEISLAKDLPPTASAKDFKQWENMVFKVPGISMTKAGFSSVFKGGIQRDLPDPGNVVYNAGDFYNSFNQFMGNVWTGKQSAAQGLEAVQNGWQKYLQH